VTIGVALQETMSGWIQFNDEGVKHPFSFSIRAFSSRVFRISAPRSFRGVAEFDDYHKTVPVKGEMKILLDGPTYSLYFHHEKYGDIHIVGKKEYGKNGFIKSLLTCPLKIYQNNEVIGEAEVMYRDPIWSFPFKSLRLVRAENAYGTYNKA